MTKFNAWCIVLLFFVMPCFGQNVAINEDGSLPHPKAILDIKSTNKGLLIPRMSTNDRLALQAPTGLLVFDTTTMSFWYSARQDSVNIWRNLATGASWSLGGNYLTDSNYFLGTTSRMALRIKAWGQPSGCIDPLGQNTFWGYRAGYSNPIPVDSPGTGSTAIGAFSLQSNTAGRYNTATGMYSLRNNINGDGNTATGCYALNYNTTGSQNSATGNNSLVLNTTGLYNTAVGSYALSNNSTGSYNTAIGFGTNVTRDNFTNATAIGYGAVVNTSNKVRIGNSAVTVIEGQVPFTVPSDGRYKFQVKEDVKGLDFILQLRPVTYQFDVKRFNNQYSQAGAGHESNTTNYALQTAYDEAINLRRSGFIAQEVEQAALATGYNFSGIIHPKTAEEHYSLSYESFVVPLVKAVQELSKGQQQLIDAQNKKIEQQDKKLIALQQQLDDIKQLLRGSKNSQEQICQHN